MARSYAALAGQSTGDDRKGQSEKGTKVRPLVSGQCTNIQGINGAALLNHAIFLVAPHSYADRNTCPFASRRAHCVYIIQKQRGESTAPTMYTGNGFLARKPPPSPIAATTSSPHRAPQPSPPILVSPSSAATFTNDLSSSEPRRRPGSIPFTTAFGLMRRDSRPASTSSAAATARRSLTVEEQQSPARKMSEPDILHNPSSLPPKRKPLPKGSAFDRPSSEHSPDLNGKLGKMDLTNGSTMVYRFYPTSR